MHFLNVGRADILLQQWVGYLPTYLYDIILFAPYSVIGKMAMVLEYYLSNYGFPLADRLDR